jgi:hypothetical protein
MIVLYQGPTSNSWAGAVANTTPPGETSHSKTLLSTKPQLIPGMSLSDCICCSWRDSMRPAGMISDDVKLYGGM